MSQVEVTARDASGRPAKLSGSYLFEGLNGRSRGSVDVVFSDGVPECLYYFDRPGVCRTANRRVAAAYVAGQYQR
ncbi:hypothetical protein tb265_42340 [Gemmatimonadetes bacterium T265]|nr:hypothetical protein tb265_42340 [Gemmatimonadetes bacterium T265]